MAEQLVKVLTRRTTEGQISMWGTLHLNAQGGTFAGWLCDAWTEAGTPGAEVLMPRLHWLSKEDDRFHLVQLDIPFVGRASITLGPVDTGIEPRREAFMRVTLAQWENEYFTTQGVQVFSAD
jgi:hypothetical protein